MVMPSTKRFCASRKAAEGKGDDERGGHQRAVVVASLGRPEEHQAKRRRRIGLVGDDDQRPEQIVPMRDDRKDRESGNRRPGIGNDHTCDDAGSDMPSRRAAWIRSSGMARKNCRNRKIPNTEIENGATSAV